MIQRNIQEGDNIYTVSKKKLASLNYFWIGFSIYTLFYGWSTTNNSFLSPALSQGFQILGFIIFAVGAASLFKFKFDNKYLQFLFTIFLVYNTIVVLRGATYDFNSVKKMFMSVGLGILPYFTPLVILLPRNLTVYKKACNALIIMGASYIIFVFAFYDVLHDPDRVNLESQALTDIFFALWAYPVSFLLLTYYYHAGKKALFGLGKINLFAIAVMLLALFFSIYRARRGSIFMCATTMMAIIMIYFIYSKNKAMMIFTGVVFAGAIGLFMAGRNTPSIFNFLIERSDEDTRTGVEEYMKADMSSTDWIIGKGFNAHYFCPTVEDVNDIEGLGYREVVETGYLQIILTSGIVGLVLLMMILIPAAFLGIFKSQNILSKGAGIFVLLWVIYEYPTISVGFTMHYILVWISAGICYSQKIRNLPDMAIKAHFQRSI